MVKQREYLFSVDEFNRPVVMTKQKAIALILVRLILLDPGSNPLHPDMGVGIRQYRYTMNTLGKLRQRVEDQIETYLPMYRGAKVSLDITPDKLCNIQIQVDDTMYVYESATGPVQISIEDLKN